MEYTSKLRKNSGKMNCNKISKLTSFYKPSPSETTSSAATSKLDDVSDIDLSSSSANIIPEQLDLSEPGIDASKMF